MLLKAYNLGHLSGLRAHNDLLDTFLCQVVHNYQGPLFARELVPSRLPMVYSSLRFFEPLLVKTVVFDVVLVEPEGAKDVDDDHGKDDQAQGEAEPPIRVAI